MPDKKWPRDPAAGGGLPGQKDKEKVGASRGSGGQSG